MGYLVEQYRDNKEMLLESLYKAKMEICKAIEELEGEPEYEERNYRMNKRMSHRGRYDY